MDTRGDPRDWVRDYYGRILAKSEDLATNACCATGAPPRHLAPLLGRIDDRVLERFYGCGYPIPEAVVAHFKNQDGAVFES